MSEEQSVGQNGGPEPIPPPPGPAGSGSAPGTGGERPGPPQNIQQVWSLTQFYSVEFSKSRIDVEKCVFNKRTIKVCVSCC